METLQVHLFKDSFGPFMKLLNEHGVKYTSREVRSGPMASGEIIELILSTAISGAFATVVVAYLHRHRGRKVIVTTKEGAVMHIEGHSLKETEKILEQAKNIMVVETEPEPSAPSPHRRRL